MKDKQVLIVSFNLHNNIISFFRIDYFYNNLYLKKKGNDNQNISYALKQKYCFNILVFHLNQNTKFKF